MAGPQAHQVTGVRDIREFGHLHKALFRDLAAERCGGVKVLAGRGEPLHFTRVKWKKTLLLTPLATLLTILEPGTLEDGHGPYLEVPGYT